MLGIADYHFVRTLADGGNGRFYLAQAPPRLGLDGAQVAVKVMAGRTNEDSFRRATRELRAFAAAPSPYLVALLDAGQQDGVFYYSMEYCPMGSLADPVGRLTPADVVLAVAQAARGAHALHEAGLVHRSIKPANVLLRQDGARLSDLGLVQALQPRQTMTGLGPVGAVDLIDPAVLLGRPASRASDVWSLGATLHQALAGRGLYGDLPEDEPLVAVRRVLGGHPEVDPGLRPEVASLVRRCVSTEPADRPPNALALAEALEALG